jgi:hypothetical protein
MRTAKWTLSVGGSMLSSRTANNFDVAGFGQVRLLRPLMFSTNLQTTRTHTQRCTTCHYFRWWAQLHI